MTEVAAFPWARVPRIDRAALTARRQLVERVLGALDPGRLGLALSQLLGEDVALIDGHVIEAQVTPGTGATPSDAILVQFPGHGVQLRVQPEADLLRACVARLLEQEFVLGWADTGIDAALRGAGAALVLEVARRAARDEAPVLRLDGAARGPWQLLGTASVRLAGKPYHVQLCVEECEVSRPVPATRAAVGLGRLGGLCISVPWICAVSSATLDILEQLEAGDVWLPGKEAWFGGEATPSAGVLAPPSSELGVPVRVSGGRIVLGAGAVRVHEELESSMREEDSGLEQIVGETPLCVRLEVGSLEMSAAEWAALRPGDVVQSGRRIDDAVILRAGGREIARGELVDIEGELGVRITQVGSATVAR